MKLNINIVTELLAYEADSYKKQYDALVNERENELQQLRKNFIANTELFKRREAQIEEDFNQKVTQARVNALDRALPELQELKQQEFAAVKKFPSPSLVQLQGFRDLPLAESELKIISERVNAKNDYWSSRILQLLCEKNGVSPSALNLPPSIETKESILNELQRQFELIISHYPDGGRDHNRDAARYAKFLYLNSDVCERAKQLFNGEISKESPEAQARKAYLTIKGQSSEISRGMVARNTLKNATPAVRDELLAKLSADENFSSNAAELAGVRDEIAAWKGGKLEQFNSAKKLMGDIRKSDDKNTVMSTLQKFSENAFLSSMYQDELSRGGGLSMLMMSGESPAGSPAAAAAATT